MRFLGPRGWLGLTLAALVVAGVVLFARRPAQTPTHPQTPVTASASPRAAAPAATAMPAVPLRPVVTQLVDKVEQQCQLQPEDVAAATEQDRQDVESELERRRLARRARWGGLLENSDDLRLRVAGILMRNPPSPQAQSVQGGEQPGAGWRWQSDLGEELAQLTATASDGAAYGLALEACGMERAATVPGACSRLSLARWTRLEPDNAWPWLMSAIAARASGNSAAEESAMQHVAEAKNFEHPIYQIVRESAAQRPTQVSGFERNDFDNDLMTPVAMVSSRMAGGFMEYPQFCAAGTVTAPVRHALCERLTHALLERGQTLMEIHSADRVAATLHWPAEQLASMQRDYDGMLKAMSSPLVATGAMTDGAPHDCSPLRAMSERIESQIALGELGLARQLLAQQREPSQIHQ